jgi:gamma-glutamylcyclotransferase
VPPQPRHYFLYAPAELPPRRLKLPAPAPATLEGFDLVYDTFSEKWSGRVASLRKQPGSSVHGLLYALTPPQLAAVAAWREGEAQEEVEVKLKRRSVKAVAFVTAPARRTLEGAVSEKFLGALVRGVAQARLPQPYVQRLQAEAAIVERVQKYGREKGLL